MPKGSVLGPLIFLIYVNDLPNVLTCASPFMFADDTTITLSHTSNQILYQNMNNELQRLDTWFKTNKLSLNISKTKYIMFRSKYKRELDAELNLKINDIILTRVSNINFLGMQIDEFLSWDNHISNSLTKRSYSLYILKCAKNFIPTNLLKHRHHRCIALSQNIESKSLKSLLEHVYDSTSRNFENSKMLFLLHIFMS